jgi:YYY domain-containing protein
MIGQFLAWYIVVQLITLVTLPLAWRLFAHLPDRGYGFARVLGILLVGYLFWIGYSFGVVRFEPGAAWLAVLVLAVASIAAGWPVLKAWRSGVDRPRNWRYVLVVEVLFLVAFAAWAWVRSHDPAASHTEKPMDLMFMNSIRASATYPSMDAWLAGYPISYYYFGYWLVTSVGMLAGQPPEIAYNLGQACWYGMLLTGCFAVAYNLLVAMGRRFPAAATGGVVSALLVGMAANLQGILEWLYANGVNVAPLAAVFQVPNFPQEAAVTNQWFVDYGWWWWRSSRVIEDLDLSGNHIEVIDEFPVFSYILGDNHPHVLAMPFVLLVIGLALNLFLAPQPPPGGEQDQSMWRRVRAVMPLGWVGWSLVAVASGALLFLNTWDYPPYWLLLALALWAVLIRVQPTGVRWRVARAGMAAAATAVLLAVAALLLYFPYFLTAQSQANGVVPNLFYPTKIGQFTAMFGTALLLLVALIVIAWQQVKPRPRQWLVSLGLVYGLPILFLLASLAVATTTPWGRTLLERTPLPEGATAHWPFALARWTTQPITFLLAGALLGLVIALVWRALTTSWTSDSQPTAPLQFLLMMAGIGLFLVYVPEFVFLRDNFGTRMNTIFKFYYQAWLLFGLAGGVTAVIALRQWRGWRLAPALLSTLALILAVASTIFFVAGAYSKANGFANEPTFDATAYLGGGGADELAAVRWIRDNTRPSDLVLEGKGASYRAETSRISTMTGRPTLLGWDGHESQWRGKAYGEMAADRPQAIEAIYQSGTSATIAQLIDQWGIDYVYVGPIERAEYGVTPQVEQRLRQVMDLVFESGEVRIYRAR